MHLLQPCRRFSDSLFFPQDVNVFSAHFGFWANPTGRFGLEQEEKQMRVLLAVDGSPHSQHATEAVGQLSSVKSLTVVHVVNLPRLSYPALGPDIAQDLAMTIEQAMREEGEHVLKRAMSHLSYHNGPVSKRLEIGSPADRILSIAEEEHTDLILIGIQILNHGRHGLNRTTGGVEDRIRILLIQPNMEGSLFKAFKEETAAKK